MKPSFLKKANGAIYVYTDMLAKRADMEPYYPKEPADTDKAGAEAAAPPADDANEAVDEDGKDTAEDSPDYQSMHWQTLKKLVEDAGGEWSSKDAAIEFLRGAQ